MKQTYFTRKRVVVIQDGVIVEHYPNLHAFVEAYPLASYICISQRVKNCKDGWMTDGKIARYYTDRNKAGTLLALSKIRERHVEVSERDKWRADLAETEAKIQAAYDACERGEITYEQRHQRLGWLQNHAAVLRKRLGVKDE